FLFVSAMTPLVMRELSIAWGKKDTQAMGHLLTRFAPLLYVIAAYFSCFTVIEASCIVHLFGGEEFFQAILPVQIMALYPLHQAYGQLAGSVFHATGKTHVLRNMTALECLYGLAVTWFFLAPSELYGLGLGATGLAIKTVCVQCISVNCYLYLASRFLPLHFVKNLCHQITSLLILLGLAYLCRSSTMALGLGESTSLVRCFISGLAYTGLVSILCLLWPKLVGMRRAEIFELVHRVLTKKR
ncbi:MAG: lipopolysaccharide biosynthesis protein, partial [Desulfovibrio sp.]|nr:lipopolysaccharide biosynthesis protein [Desulfovibrio sp.]